MTLEPSQFDLLGTLLKLIFALIGGTVTIMATILGTYYGIVRRFDRMDGDRDLLKLEIQTLKANVDKIEMDIKELKSKIQ